MKWSVYTYSCLFIPKAIYMLNATPNTRLSNCLHQQNLRCVAVPPSNLVIMYIDIIRKVTTYLTRYFASTATSVSAGKFTLLAPSFLKELTWFFYKGESAHVAIFDVSRDEYYVIEADLREWLPCTIS